MKIIRKCKFCGALLSETNSVFAYISRYDNRGKSSKSFWMCCKCWDNTMIKEPYYHIDQLPDPECTVNIKDNPHKCGNCKYLIFKDHRHNEGLCRITRLNRRYTDLCVHEEEMT